MNNTLFFDMNDAQLKEIGEKYALLEPLLDSYLVDSEKRRLREEVREKLGISGRSLRRLIHKAREKGISALIRRRRSDYGKARRFDEKILAKALELLEESPHRSVPMLMSLLKADEQTRDIITDISPHTLYHHLKASGYDFKKKRESSTKIYHRFEADYPNQLWQGDARDGIYLPDPEKSGKTKKTYLFGWIDDYSRKIMYAKYYWDEKLPRMEDCFRQAILRWGMPEKIYCDNGSVYIAEYFLITVTELGIKKIHHPAYAAWCKGKIENGMKTIKRFQQEAQLAGFKTLAELNASLQAWLELEYNRKIHSTTGEAPNDRFRNGIAGHPPKRVMDIDAFNRLFFFRIPRKVDKYGKLRYENNYYPVRGIATGQPVDVWFDPFDLSEVLVYYKKEFFCKTKASILKTKEIIKDIPEEKSHKDISQASVNYFQKLREQYNERILGEAASMRFADLHNKEEQA
jgi:transposase InsO family protein